MPPQQAQAQLQQQALQQRPQPQVTPQAPPATMPGQAPAANPFVHAQEQAPFLQASIGQGGSEKKPAYDFDEEDDIETDL